MLSIIHYAERITYDYPARIQYTVLKYGPECATLFLRLPVPISLPASVISTRSGSISTLRSLQLFYSSSILESGRRRPCQHCVRWTNSFFYFGSNFRKRACAMSTCCSRREGLKLALNRSLSEPGPPDLNISPVQLALSPTVPKRCKLDSMSLPSSPCSESATVQRAIIMQHVKPLDPDGLVKKLERNESNSSNSNSNAGSGGGGSKSFRNFLVVDCRSFIAYNVNHIRGSININCSDRFNRRRLQMGKASLADLATTREGKDLLRKRAFKEIVVYDDCTADVDRLPVSHPLFLVLTTLVEDNREPALLLGEFFFISSAFPFNLYQES